MRSIGLTWELRRLVIPSKFGSVGVYGWLGDGWGLGCWVLLWLRGCVVLAQYDG